MRIAAPSLLLSMLLALAAAGFADTRAIDPSSSVITVHVSRSGLFSVFAHDHNIRGEIARGQVQDSDPAAVELWIPVDRLQVMDQGVSEKDRAEIQRTMLGPQVLDAAQYPEIHFRSSSIRILAGNHWTVTGNLDLHGATRPVTVDVTEQRGRYHGSATVQQRDFGITPITIAGGTVRVKDAVQVEFDLATAANPNQ